MIIPPAKDPVVISEWKIRHLDGVSLPPQDQALASALSDAQSGRLRIDQLVSGLRLEATSWVGVVRFSDFELRVVPKLAGGDKGLLSLVDYASGLDALDRYPAVHTFDTEKANLLDLVALLFAESCESIVRGGLLADYQEMEDDLPVVRGRLLVERQVLRRFGRIDRLECRFDEHTTDITENQLLLAALTAAQRHVQDNAVLLRINVLQSILSESCSIDTLDLRAVRGEVAYNRMNAHYREAHGLAWLLLDGLGIEDLYAGQKHERFAFMLDMNRLFEDFVTRWISEILADSPFRSIAQRKDRTILWNADTNRPHASVIPDIVILRRDEPDHFLPVDAKYKLYDESKVSNADVYQSFLYAFAFGRPHVALPAALLIYPSSDIHPTFENIEVRHAQSMPRAEISALGVNIPAILQDRKSRVIGEAGAALLGRLNSSGISRNR